MSQRDLGPRTVQRNCYLPRQALSIFSGRRGVGWAALGIIALCVCSGVAADDLPSFTEFEAIREYRDEAFIGGLNARGVQLARKLAQRLKAELPGKAENCEPPDPLRGMVVAGAEPSAAPALSPWLDKVVAALPDSSPAQRAALLLALRFTGPKAREAAGPIGARNTERDAWAVEALNGITCDSWTGGDVNLLVPRPHFEVAEACGSTHFRWLLTHTLDVERYWPAALVQSTRDELNECDSRPALTLTSKDTERLARVLEAPKVDRRFKAAWLDNLADHGQHFQSLAPVLAVLASSDDEISWSAQRALIASGTQEGAAQFARWLKDDVFHWAWGDVSTHVKTYPAIVVPALQVAAHSPTWSNRAAAIEVLSEMQTPGTAQIIIDAISPLDWPTAQAAAGALGQLAAEDAVAKRALEDLATTYWSGRVRAVAEFALRTGKGFSGNPFACNQTIDERLKTIEAGQLDCVEFCYGCALEHQLPACGEDGPANGRYELPTGERVYVRWTLAKRKRIPRIRPEQVSSWCASRGSTVALRVDGGWLVGCDGFEREGMLVFVPRHGEPTVTNVAHLGVTVLARAEDRIFLAGSSPFEFGDAGALYEVQQDSGAAWKTTPIAALPSVPDGYAVINDRIAFRDAENAVIFDPKGNLLPLKPIAQCVPSPRM